MEKISLSASEHHKLVQYGKRLFERGTDGPQVYSSLVDFCRDNFGSQMTQRLIIYKIFDVCLLEYKKSTTYAKEEDYYYHEPEVWDKKTCAEKARYKGDYPFTGYIGSTTSGSRYNFYGFANWNGGCSVDGKYYRKGEYFPLPHVADGYDIIKVPTWGYRIVKKSTP